MYFNHIWFYMVLAKTNSLSHNTEYPENHKDIFLVWTRHLAVIDHLIPHTTGWWGQQHLLYLQETFHQFNMGTHHHFFRAIINIVCEIINLRDCWHSSKSFENSNSTSIQNTNKFYITKYKHILNNHLTLFMFTKIIFKN